jgi:hypothetical protein
MVRKVSKFFEEIVILHMETHDLSCQEDTEKKFSALMNLRHSYV